MPWTLCHLLLHPLGVNILAGYCYIVTVKYFPAQKNFSRARLFRLSLLAIKSLKEGEKLSYKTGTLGHQLDLVGSYGKSYFREISSGLASTIVPLRYVAGVRWRTLFPKTTTFSEIFPWWLSGWMQVYLPLVSILAGGHFRFHYRNLNSSHCNLSFPH